MSLSSRWRLPALGPRGEGWVVLQLGLYGALALAALRGRSWPAPVVVPFRIVSLPCGLAGAALIISASLELGGALTPNPRPRDDAALQESRAYSVVRHPIYGGVILGALSSSLWFGPTTVAPAVMTAVFMELKSRREEEWLVERYASYAGYRRRVRRRFLPYVW